MSGEAVWCGIVVGKDDYVPYRCDMLAHEVVQSHSLYLI